MVEMVIIIILLSFGQYMFWFLGLWRLFKNRQNSNQSTQVNHNQCISLIIAFRNEIENLPMLCSAISALSYDNTKYEIILVDDHSTDGSATYLKTEISNGLYAQLFELEEGFGKKQAISLGISKSKGEIIATTDADCWFQPTFLMEIGTFFENSSQMLRIGPVFFEGRSGFWAKMAELEFLGTVASGAAAAGLGQPTMANGANFAYRREVFEKWNGFSSNQNIASGDDMFLLHQQKKLKNRGISFAVSQDSVVLTHPPKSFSEFLNQKIRWAGKWRSYSDLGTILVAVFVFLLQLCWLSIPFLVLEGLISLPFLGSLLLIKILLEASFLFSFSSAFQRQFSWTSFLTWQVLFPWYVVLIGLLATFFPKFDWKGRRYGR